MMFVVLGQPMRHRPRHLRYNPRFGQWVDVVAVVLVVGAAVLAALHPHLVWWVVLAIAVVRILFSVAGRWNKGRRTDHRERWLETHDAN
jgi:hypothetical protein